MWITLICVLLIVLHFYARIRQKKNDKKNENLEQTDTSIPTESFSTSSNDVNYLKNNIRTFSEKTPEIPKTIEIQPHIESTESISEKTPFLNLDDLITYEEDNGIVYGYLNLEVYRKYKRIIGDINIKWLTNSFAKIKKGEALVEVGNSDGSQHKISSILKSPSSGLLIYEKLLSINQGYKLFTLYHDETKLKDSYPNEIVVDADEFTKVIIVKGSKYGGNVLGFEFNIGFLCKIYFKFENIAGDSYLTLRFARKDMNLNKKCILHLLLDDGSVVTLNAVANPVKLLGTDSEIKYRMSPQDMVKLETEKFLKWQITNEDGLSIKSGNNNCCVDDNDTSGVTKDLSYIVFQDFIKQFNKTVKEHISENIDKIDTKENERPACYVYLMIDTTNNFHKIGISNNPKYREHTLQSDKPTIELICAKEYPSRAIAEAIELALHQAYANKRIRGEWFNLDITDIEHIKQTLN